jgi:hypothetical protein
MRHFLKAYDVEGVGLGPHGHHHVPVPARAHQGVSRHSAHAGVDKEALFRSRDWGKVKELLEAGRTSGTSEEARGELASALAQLRASLYGPVLPAAAIIGPLVDVWALAEQVEPGAAKPAEALLCAMEGCDLVAAGQVSAACDQVEAVLKVASRSSSNSGVRRLGAEGLVVL